MVSSEASVGEACSPEATRQYGITKPISLSGPSGSDLQRSRELEEFLVSVLFGLYESESVF
jgi:poly(A) polymerase